MTCLRCQDAEAGDNGFCAPCEQSLNGQALAWKVRRASRYIAGELGAAITVSPQNETELRALAEAFGGEVFEAKDVRGFVKELESGVRVTAWVGKEEGR
jgi:hypothetical protein